MCVLVSVDILFSIASRYSKQISEIATEFQNIKH